MLLAEVNSEASRSRGSRSRAIVGREGGGWAGRSAAPCATQLEEDTPWRD